MSVSVSAAAIWREDLARADIIRLTTSCKPTEPDCTQFLFPGLRGLALVQALDTYVDNLLLASDAVDMRKPPFVWLSRLAKTLQADLFWVTEARASGYVPTIRNEFDLRGKWQRGRISPGRDGRWKLLAGRKHEGRSRADVAHELAHAALYTKNGQINYDRWQRARWTPIEECVCNYVARRFIAPPPVISALRNNKNLAIYILDQFASLLNIPVHEASLRWLDDDQSELKSGRVLVLLWRQYHPLDHLFASWIVKGKEYSPIRKELYQLTKALRQHSVDVSFDDAWKLWRAVMTPEYPQKGIASILESNSELQAYTRIFRAAVDRLEPDLQQLVSRKLAGRDLPASFRTEWFAWRRQPDAGFVPFKRGGCKPNTLAYQLADTNTTADNIVIEDVHLANLYGRFECHGFAHGDASKGKRFVLQVLREIDPISDNRLF